MNTSAKPLAVVTGASSGIGRELAIQFADHDFDLVIAAEDAAIEEAAEELRRHGAQVEVLQADLTEQAEVDRLCDMIRNASRPVDALALNAGRGNNGSFAADNSLDEELDVVDLNVRSTVQLAKELLPSMIERGEGRVLFTSSVASTMPGSQMAVYNASKSFVQSFALALRDELRDTGVTVTSLMPGATESRFWDRADMRDTTVGAGNKSDPADVARDGFEAMMNGRERVVSAKPLTKLQTAANKYIPDRVKAKLQRRMAEPGSARS
jgi:short-subunit dehydrogenase